MAKAGRWEPYEREVHVRFWGARGVRFPAPTHLPLYRQSRALARQGIEIGREVLASWLGVAAFEIRPVVGRMREILLGFGAGCFADETTHAGARARPGQDQDRLCLGDRAG